MSKKRPTKRAWNFDSEMPLNAGTLARAIEMLPVRLREDIVHVSDLFLRTVGIGHEVVTMPALKTFTVFTTRTGWWKVRSEYEGFYRA